MQESDQIFVDSSEVALRLDQILALRFKGRYSRTYFQKLIEEGLVLLNGSRVKKRIKPAANDEIEIEFVADQIAEIIPENIPLDILYEDQDILVINKPSGLVVHPAPGNWTGTFVNALAYYCQSPDLEKGIRPGIVHRLDKDTSGVLIAAKNSYAQNRLVEAFSKREVLKLYHAIVVGKPNEQVIKAPIGRHPIHRKKMGVLEEGKAAISHVKPIASDEKLSLVEIKIETGRTHQIRVHLAYIGRPVLGDDLYGIKSYNEKYKTERQMLHAHLLEIAHPRTGEKMTFIAPPPADFTYFSTRLLSCASGILKSIRN